MIKFRTLRYKNFLSTGDAFTEIPLDAFNTTLVVGSNGAGKSTMLDALSFALFGKAHRNITKTQLVNTINGKGMLVEVEFSIGSSNYKVVRGVKPNVFEIHKDDKMLNQSSHNKEYQRILEQNILKLNHKSFHQIVVLGSSSFIPFMQLPANHRREVIEDLLDINVFSKMNGILKERANVLKDNVRNNKGDLDFIEMKVKAQKKYVQQLKDLNNEAKQEKLQQIKELEEKIEHARESMPTISEESVEGLKSHKKSLQGKLAEINKFNHQFSVKLKELKKELTFYEKNDTCPTCDQDIPEELKQSKTEAASAKYDEINDAKTKAEYTIGMFNDKIDKVTASIDENAEMIKQAEQAQFQISEYQSTITSLQSTLSKYDSDSGDIDQAREDLEEYERKRSRLLDIKADLAEQASYHVIVSEMFKDTGIKTKIIKQYIPVINNLVNKYLQVLDFYVSFHLDDTFKESIRSRHRDDFSYDSFSEGEKQRIDLALLFTWRQVAKMKNSVATNLLILDETFDSSLDTDGVDNLTKILDTLDDQSNVFIISHKGELLENKFENKIEFTKVKNFSKIV